MKSPLTWKSERQFGLALIPAAIIGLCLRLYLFKDQVIADDEWHGLFYVIGKSPTTLLMHFSVPGATCIPLNLYAWILYATVGWSEVLLRLPSLTCGVIAVVVGPWLARGIIGERRAVLLSLLMAPLLTFYSRICRPYSAVAFFAFAAILLAAHSMQRGGRRPAIGLICAGVASIYFHLYAVVVVAAPVLAALTFHICAR